MDVQLKVNMIIAGRGFVPYGTVIDREEIPSGIRKERYYDEPGKVEPLYVSESDGQNGGGGDDDDDEPNKGEPPPQPIPPPPPVARQSSLRRGGNMDV
jgi:hypothetical protein